MVTPSLLWKSCFPQKRSDRRWNMTGNELVTTSDNRYLRKIIHDMTKGCLLTRNEFQAIIRILELAVDRMLWEAEDEQTGRKER